MPAHLLPRLKSPSQSLLRNTSLDSPHHEKQKIIKSDLPGKPFFHLPVLLAMLSKVGSGGGGRHGSKTWKFEVFCGKMKTQESNHTRTGIFLKNTPHTKRPLSHRRWEKSGRDRQGSPAVTDGSRSHVGAWSLSPHFCVCLNIFTISSLKIFKKDPSS